MYPHELREALKTAPPSRIDPADVPDNWPRGLFVRTMSGRARCDWNEFVDAFNQLPDEQRSVRYLAETYAGLCLCNAQGVLIYGDESTPPTEPVLSDEAKQQLALLDGDVLDRIYLQGKKLSRMEANSAEETLKNSDSGRGDSSSSASAASSASPTPATSTPSSTPQT